MKGYEKAKYTEQELIKLGYESPSIKHRLFIEKAIDILVNDEDEVHNDYKVLSEVCFASIKCIKMQ